MPPSPISLAAALSPHGVPRLDPAAEGAAPLDPALARALTAAFERGPGHGVLALGAIPDDAPIAPSLAHLRAFTRIFLREARAVADLETTRDPSSIRPAVDLDAWRAATPPMTGAEYLTTDAATGLWAAVAAAFTAEWRELGGSLESFLVARGSRFHQVGRVFFHLAENKRDPDAPFAFLATYTTGVSAGQRLQHVPLGKALEEYAGARAGAKNTAALLSLLAPVQRAADKSAKIRAMVDAGEIYHPLAWTPQEAYAFLREAPVLETSGVVVRLPDWWRANAARPEVRVTVGKAAPSQLGKDALLDFSIEVVLGGEPLTREEQAQLARGGAGLVSLRGRWVEVDPERLAAVLRQWRAVERDAAGDGISFLAGMRMLAGVALDPGEEAPLTEEARVWSRVTAGDWLATTLEDARRAAAGADPGSALRATLRPYQRQGVRWLSAMARLGLGACLADDMGLGKTIQVLAVLLLRAKDGAEARGRRPSLLVLPASLLGNWRSEMERFAPSLRALVAHTAFTDPKELEELSATDLAPFDVVLTTYGALHRTPWIARAKWDLVVLDEAQAIKNPAAKQTRAAKALQATARIALTGTPVENRTGDLHSLFDFLLPGLLGTPEAFTRLTRRLSQDPRGYGPLRELVRPYLLRRLKSDKNVVPDLPDKTEVRAFCALTREQAVLYEKNVSAMKEALARSDGVERRGIVLSFLLRFKQLCNHPSQLLGDGVFAEAASGKFRRLAELCETMAARQEKVLVFTQFREMCAPIAQHLARVFGRDGLVLHGQTAVAKRKALVDAFQSDDGPPFFVLSLKAGGTGLNLTAASHVVHFDRWWNPAVENQATDRAYRIGQKKNVMVHKFVCRGTLEEKIDAMLEDKRALAGAIVEAGGEVPLTEMSDAELTRLVSLDIHAALDDA